MFLGTLYLSGEHHDHQRQSHPAEAELAGAGPRDEQRVQGVSHALTPTTTRSQIDTPNTVFRSRLALLVRAIEPSSLVFHVDEDKIINPRDHGDSSVN